MQPSDRFRSILRFTSFFLLTASLHAFEVRELNVAGSRYTVCSVHLEIDSLDIFLNDRSGNPLNRFDRVNEFLKPSGRRLVFAMNAGMYHVNFQPVGLFITNGITKFPINLSDSSEGNFYLKPNGVFAVDSTGHQAFILESKEFASKFRKILLATQSGPLLLRKGRIHPAFRLTSTSRLYRNGVGISSDQVIHFVISENPVNFYEFANFFRQTLACRDALFLDGTISSLYCRKIGRNDFRLDLGPIFGVTEKIPQATGTK